MTNLPITASTAQTAAPGKQSANANDSADASSQPFGEVLARQIATPEVKVAKKDDKLAADLAAQISGETTDIKKDDKAAAEVASTLPADMLAALLPQAMTATVAAAAPAGAGTAADTTAALQDGIGVTARKAGSTAGVQAEVSTTYAPLAAAEPQLKEQSFAATLANSATRTATNTEALAVAREASAAATVAAAASVAAQQPNAAALASIQNAVAGIAAPVVQASAAMSVNTPINQPRWGDEFSQKITWLASSKMDQSAELHLNPPQLGPLDVVLKVSGDQATALFTSPHAAVREAIEQALPRLRDMLADNGITLGNTTVSDQAPREQSKSDAQRTAGNSGNDLRDTAAGSNNAARVSPISRHNGIVDTFA